MADSKIIFNRIMFIEFFKILSYLFCHLPAYIFSPLYKLESLDLSDNNLKQVKDYMFVGLTSLKKLNLADNPGVVAVSKESLGLPQLEELYLK